MRNPTVQHFPQRQPFDCGEDEIEGIGNYHLTDNDHDEAETIWDPLQLAASSGNLVEVNALLADGRNPNALPQGWYGKTALQVAALHGHLAVVQVLLASGAQVDAPGGNNGGRTALTLAAGATTVAHQVQSTIIDRLLHEGADVNHPPHPYMGRTPVQAAAEGGNLTILRCLVALGGDIRAPAAKTSGRTALQAAAEQQHIEFVVFLLQQGVVVTEDDMRVSQNKAGVTALQAAASVGNKKLVKTLVDAGANVNAKGSRFNGCSALGAAAGGDFVDIIWMLIDAGADLDQVEGNHGRTAMQVARVRGSMNAVRVLKDAAQRRAYMSSDIDHILTSSNA
ncbi:ankyrin [Polychaeton citri CBS 116435]|uniref:Ankyrin n=1 Tax=Polychaeton citri CBS 116435 TaxID=1314669 RepID=A0A9P4UNS9_9PEZI|nr:ankyrin [Polychaeton citri CBS 116435]